MNQRRQWRSKNPFRAFYLDGGESFEIPAESLLKRLAGPLHDEIPAGDPTRFDVSGREVFFDFGSRHLKTTWTQFHVVGDCEEI